MNKPITRLAAILLIISLIFSVTAIADSQLPYRIAEKSEGASLLLANTAYADTLTQLNLDYRVQKKGATIEDWREFVAEQALDFTDAERQALSDGMNAIEEILAENAYSLPKLDELVFVRTTQREECGSEAYTLGNQIYLGGYVPELLGSKDADQRRFGQSVLCHEIFHCLTRNNPEFRRDMYALLHFTVHDAEFELSPELKEVLFTNPDVGRHDASASFIIDGAATECYIACVVETPFEQPGDNPFFHVETALVPVDHPDTYFKPEDAENFWDVFGKNTSYVLDPEECLADNFGFALMYDDADPDGNPFPNPEILDAIREYLRK